MKYLIAHGIKSDRLTAMGYGESRPKIVRRKLTEQYQFLHEGDTLTEEYIKKLSSDDDQEICNALNRRTEFRVLRTTYGMTMKEIQENMNKKPEQPARKNEEEDDFLF